MQREALLEAAREALLALGRPILAAYVFGSVARNTHTAQSDLDLALLSGESGANEPDELGGDFVYELERRLRRPVDVIMLRNVSADLTHRVLRDGILIVDNDRRARVEFEVRSRAEYLDLAPLRRLYRRLPAELSNSEGASKDRA